MACPDWYIVISSIALVFTIASAFYAIVTACMPTPVKNSLSPQQRIIRKKESKKRGMIFGGGLVLGIVVAILCSYGVSKGKSMVSSAPTQKDIPTAYSRQLQPTAPYATAENLANMRSL
tara:strand:+ start:35 stop:391 length:357 start_codon:yes stop_codon:yes gene_type:complete